MRNPKEIKSIPKISSILLLTIGGITTIVLGIKSILIGIEKPSLLIIGIPLLAFGLYCFYWLLNYDVLLISNGKLIFKSITGYTKKTISLNELKSYSEIEKDNASRALAHIKWKDLTLISENFNYKLSSTSYSNYQELRDRLTIGLKRNTKFENDWQNKNSTQIGIGSILFGLFLGYWLLKHSGNHLNEILIIVLITSVFIGGGAYLIINRRNASR